jgi:hypothetical protein
MPPHQSSLPSHTSKLGFHYRGSIESPFHHPGIGLHSTMAFPLDMLRLAVADADFQRLRVEQTF